MKLPAHVLRTVACGVLMLQTVSLASGAVTGRTNLAKYQSVSASTTGGTYGPDLAVDGLVSNFHSFRTANTSLPQWLEVAYPRPVTLASAHLYTGIVDAASPAGVFAGFKFQYYNGTAWLDVPGSTVTGNTAVEVNVVFSQSVTADRFRLYSTDTGSRTVRELAFFPPNPAGGIEQGFALGTDVRLNLAYQRPATSSSANLTNAYGAGYAKNAFDGYIDNTSRWLCTSTAAGEYIEVDLLASHRIGSAHVYTGYIDAAVTPRATTQPMADFTLQYWDGAGWLPVPGAAVTGNTQVARSIEFSSALTTSRIRLVTTSASGARLQELLLFPPRAGGYPLGREVADAPPPAYAWDRYSDSSYRLRNWGPDLRLGLVQGVVAFNSPANGFVPEIEWQLLLNYRDGSYRIRHPATGKCLALGAVSLAANTPVVAEDYTGLPHQDWFLEFVDSTRFRLVNAYSGLALQSLNNSWSNGATLVVQPADTNLLQQWSANYQRSHPKKGIAATGALIRTSATPYVTDSDLTFIEDFYNRFQGNWSYGWGRQTSDTFPFMGTAHAYNPMQWGNYNWTHGSGQGPLERIYTDLQSNPKPVHLLGFNEPDGASQANMTAAAAITCWPRLLAQNVPLVAPVPANAFGGWLADFSTQADALGYRRDYTAVHWYKAPDADALIADLQQSYNTFGRPVWLTEFSAVRWSGTATWTAADNFNFLAEFMWRAEALTWLKRYALFSFVENTSGANQSAPDPADAPRSNALRADGSLTAFGELYAGWDGVASVVNDKAYYLHNKKEYRRVQNPGPSSTPADAVASVSPESSVAGNQWFLTPGTTAGTVRLVSTRDGRRLRYYNGTYVGLVASTVLTGQSEWRLVADANGWYFLEHPQSGTRLRINSSGTLLYGSITGATDDYKWRFVRPAVSDPAGAPAAPANLTTSVSANSVTLAWSAVSSPSPAYTVYRSATGADPWTQVATGLSSAQWTDPNLGYSADYYYYVTATNLYALTSAASAVVSATTPAPPDPYVTWTALKLGGLPSADQLPSADPDGDGLPNLLEYALGTEPRTPAPTPVQTLAANGRLQITFLRAVSDLNYEVLAGSDLLAWSVIATNPGAVGTAVTVTDTVLLSAAPRRFIRLRVTKP